MNTKTVYDFNKKADIQNWKVVNDVVMGGNSDSQIKINSDGCGVFTGHVSLANNGGFSLVRYSLDNIAVETYHKIKIRLKGDGKNYQFRVKNNSSNNYWYIATFLTSNEWQDVVIDLKDMYPSFRGKKLDAPNFSHAHINQIAFLIGNKKDEHFKLIIDSIQLIK